MIFVHPFPVYWSKKHDYVGVLWQGVIKRKLLSIRSLHGWPFVRRVSNWQLNKLVCYIAIHSPHCKVSGFERRNRTIIILLRNVFIHNGARSRHSPQMAEPCKSEYHLCYLSHGDEILYHLDVFISSLKTWWLTLNGWKFNMWALTHIQYIVHISYGCYNLLFMPLSCWN